MRWDLPLSTINHVDGRLETIRECPVTWNSGPENLSYPPASSGYPLNAWVDCRHTNEAANHNKGGYALMYFIWLSAPSEALWAEKSGCNLLDCAREFPKIKAKSLKRLYLVCHCSSFVLLPGFSKRALGDTQDIASLRHLTTFIVLHLGNSVYPESRGECHRNLRG